MTTPIRLFVPILLGAAALLVAAPALAQGWKPEKNVEMVIGLTAGSSQDRTGRTLQKIWQGANALGVTSAVVNRVGGGGQVAWTYLSQHAGDAHYLQIIEAVRQRFGITAISASVLIRASSSLTNCLTTCFMSSGRPLNG